MKCPHCELTLIEGKTSFVLREHPYPYISKGINHNSPKMIRSLKEVLLQKINKHICGHCGKFFFSEIRLGSTINGPDQYFYQIYKAGQYRFRDFSTSVFIQGE